MARWWKHRRTVVIGAIGLALAAMAFWPQSVAVDVGRAVTGPMVVTLDEEGETRVRDRFLVTAPVTGRVGRITLEPGDAVARGTTVLARLVPSDPALLDARTRSEFEAASASAQSAVGLARAERERARVAVARAKTSLARTQQLREAGLTSADELEAQETALRSAEEAFQAADFAVSRAEHELQMARARLARPAAGGAGAAIEIPSPIDGVVLKRFRESEGVVPAGEPLLELGDPSSLEIVADYLSADAVRLSAGDRVLVEQWGGSDAIAGRVRLVEPSGFMKISALGVEEQRVNVIIDFDDPAAARRLGDNYRVEVRAVVASEERALKTPVSSLFRHDGGWAVFVVAGGRAERRAVTLGIRNDLEAQVTGGLAEGDVVIVHPPDTVTDGVRVVIRDSSN